MAHSDIDLAVCVEGDALARSAFGYDAELSAELVRALSTNRVDVVVLNRAPPLLYHRARSFSLRAKIRSRSVSGMHALARAVRFDGIELDLSALWKA